MKPPEFIVESDILKREDRICLNDREHHHMIRVRRLGPGSMVRLVDGLGNLALARIREISPQQVILERTGPVESGNDLVPLKIILAIIKGEKMDLAISKLSEMGVSQIQPVVTSRTVVSLSGSKLRKKWQRWRALSCHSLKQCRGIMATRVLKPVALEKMLSGQIGCLAKIVLCEDLNNNNLSELLKQTEPLFPMALAIGPEGGFSPEENRLLYEKGFQPADLGPRILRSETAAICSAAIVSEVFRSGVDT